MAIEVTKSAQLAATRKPVIDDHAKLRFMYAKCDQVAVADDGSSWQLVRLPPGRLRVIPFLCRYKVSGLGAARVMAIGHEAYYDRSENSAAPTAAALSAFASGISVATATEANFPTTGGMKHDFFSRDGVILRATFTGGTLPGNATGEFLIAYLYE